ncbi:MAG: ORF6N domain-containing protein [Bacteroidales bacterium]|nr:ORF6N domain-containing protein [Bacteroidales bacterium]MBQ7458207.1 ORF6N domain-containing protein [Bacteroidales bacterium]
MEKEVIVKNGNNPIPSLMSEVEEKIVIIRNQPVISDADVAALYDVQTKEINQAVRNNPDKFPSHYMFELTISELRDMRSKILTTNISSNSHSSTKVFTERGLYMLATILKGERARAVTFAIIETFAQIRELKRELLALHQEADKDKQKVENPL